MSDSRLRHLERLAKQGDPDALLSLFSEKLRTGQIPSEAVILLKSKFKTTTELLLPFSLLPLPVVEDLAGECLFEIFGVLKDLFLEDTRRRLKRLVDEVVVNKNLSIHILDMVDRNMNDLNRQYGVRGYLPNFGLALYGYDNARRNILLLDPDVHGPRVLSNEDRIRDDFRIVVLDASNALGPNGSHEKTSFQEWFRLRMIQLLVWSD